MFDSYQFMKGGYRKGAGRKKGFAAINAEEARKLLAEKVAMEIEPISEVLISAAKSGDIRAIKELFDRAWGRAPQALEIEANIGHLPVPIMGLDFSNMTEEQLREFALSDDERRVLEKKLLPKDSSIGQHG